MQLRQLSYQILEKSGQKSTVEIHILTQIDLQFLPFLYILSASQHFLKSFCYGSQDRGNLGAGGTKTKSSIKLKKQSLRKYTTEPKTYSLLLICCNIPLGIGKCPSWEPPWILSGLGTGTWRSRFGPPCGCMVRCQCEESCLRAHTG